MGEEAEEDSRDGKRIALPSGVHREMLAVPHQLVTLAKPKRQKQLPPGPEYGKEK